MDSIALTVTNIRLPANDLRALKAVAAAGEKSLSGLLREIVAGFLTRTEKLNENLFRDPLWRWGDQPIGTGDSSLSQKIDGVLYGKS